MPSPNVMQVTRRYRSKNFRHRIRPAALRAEAQKLLKLGIISELSAVVTKSDGQRIDLGVLSRRVVTSVGVQFIANAFLNTTELENMNYHGSGTGTTAEAVGDTALVTEIGVSRGVGTQTSPSNGAYRTVATQTYTGASAVTEHGIFSASTTGTLLDRSVFAAINVQNGDSISWTYTITFNAGG